MNGERDGSRLKPISLGILILASCGQIQAQTVVPLIAYTNYWAFDPWGTNLGTAWQTNDFNDEEWFFGQGLFGAETTPYPAPLNTPLWLTPPNSGSQVVTYYFRTHFECPFSEMPAGLTLVASNLVDDGCVIYLNGLEAGRIRVPQSQNYLTLASSGPPVEGVPDVISINASALRTGDNLIAVEVHQSAPTSADVVWGMSLVAEIAQPLEITNQPAGQTNNVGDSITLSVAVSGSPVHYQWRLNGNNILGANAAVYTILGNSTNQSGAYSVVVTNRVSWKTSEVARVQFVPDRSGPIMRSATVSESGLTNQILLVMSENMTLSTVRSNNLAVTHLASGSQVLISNITLVGRTILLRVGGTNWLHQDPYVITASNLKDSAGNTIAPNSEIPVQWIFRTNVVRPDQVWSYHDSAAGEPGVYDESWTSLDYVTDAWWKSGSGVFRDGSQTFDPCIGTWGTPVPYQSRPTLFRTTFEAPAGALQTNRLQLTHLIDDGAVLFLNGVEIHRFGVARGVKVSLGASADFIDQPACLTSVTVTATNFLPGINCLAVGVVQCPPGIDADMVFGLEVKAERLAGPTLDDTPPPELEIASMNPESVLISWQGGGYALESSTNLISGISYPRGPWMEETNMSNPFTNPATEPFRFFRLKKR